MTLPERTRVKREWNKLQRRAARAPHGEKRKREAELKAFAHDQLRQELGR